VRDDANFVVNERQQNSTYSIYHDDFDMSIITSFSSVSRLRRREPVSRLLRSKTKGELVSPRGVGSAIGGIV